MNEQLFWVGSEEVDTLGPKLLVFPVYRASLIKALAEMKVPSPDLIADRLAVYFRTLTDVDPARHELELIGRGVSSW